MEGIILPRTEEEERAHMEECLNILKAQQSIPWVILEASSMIELDEYMELEFGDSEDELEFGQIE